MAVANVGERVETAKRLVAGLEIDLRVVVDRGQSHGVLVVVALVDVDIDATDCVHRSGEPGEIDVDEVVDLDSRPEQLLNGAQGQLRAADRIGGVELVGAVSRDIDLEVARE
jgi:hypothetical protein